MRTSSFFNGVLPFALGKALSDISGAKVGDKTMMDALIPASQAIAAYSGQDGPPISMQSARKRRLARFLQTAFPNFFPAIKATRPEWPCRS